jgi:hypothetical protein
MAVVITTHLKTRSNAVVTVIATTAARSVKNKQPRFKRGCKTCWGAVVARQLKPLKAKPVYKGAKAFRTSGEPLLCRRCARLAQFRAMEFNGNARIDLFFCEAHLNEAIKEERGIRKIAALKEWAQHQAQLKRWNEQVAAKSQEALFA